MDQATVSLLVKPDCSLCDSAVRVARAAATRAGLSFQQVSIADDVDLADKHGEEVPALFIDGVLRDFWVLDPARVEWLCSQRAEQERP